MTVFPKIQDPKNRKVLRCSMTCILLCTACLSNTLILHPKQHKGCILYFPFYGNNV